MKQWIVVLIAMVWGLVSNAQFNGTYNAFFNGDQITLELKQNDKAINGSMKDSQQNYKISATITETGFEGTAVDDKLGITFIIAGSRTEAGLDMDFDVEYEGNRADAFVVNFEKEGAVSIAEMSGEHKSKKPIDPQIIGQWKHESFYSSGYGADAMSGSNVQYLSFNADGTMTDMGNQANISGSNYSGDSGRGQGSGTVSNLWYYTQGNQIMVYSVVNGKTEEAPMGTYYIEDGKLLITVASGEKMLLQKVR